MKRWDRTDLTILTLPLATKSQTSLTRFTSIRLVNQEDFWGATALTYFVENCLDLPERYLRNEDISKVLAILFQK